MRTSRKRRTAIGVAIALGCVALLALWQWQALARLAIVAGAEAFAHVRLSFADAQIGRSELTFDDVRVTSLRGEPIAQIAHVEAAYDLRDLLPGGRRLFGLRSVVVDSPRITIVRRPDGSFNIPIPNTNGTASKAGPPLILSARVRDGALEVLDESPAALTDHRRLYASNLSIDADVATNARTTYRAAFEYGEQLGHLYPVRGHGIMDARDGTNDQRWSAPRIPIAGAIDFAVNSDALRLRAGDLDRVDARVFAVRGGDGAMHAHLAVGATLSGAEILIGGLSKPVTGVSGAVAAYDDGILTPGLRARVAGVPATISGGLYNLKDPHLRVSVRGAGDLAQLRAAFAEAKSLPISGPLRFALLVEGNARAPLVWIALHSPHTTYAGTSVQNLAATAAFDGRHVNVLGASAAYGAVGLQARGRIALDRERNAIEMLVRARAPAGGLPYAGLAMPALALQAAVLATADDPKAIALRGALWGSGGSQSLDALFDVDQRGSGTIGPIEARSGGGTLYGRVALSGNGVAGAGVVTAHGFPLHGGRCDAECDARGK